MKWTLVTGAGQGLGAAIAQELAACGHSVVIHYRSQEQEAQKVAQVCRKKGVEAETIQGDFSTQDSLDEFIRRYQHSFSSTYALVNNVGNYHIASLSQTTPQDFSNLLHTNVTTPFCLIHSLLPSIQSHSGIILNIGTIGLLTTRANTYNSAYHLTKRALWDMTKSLAKELAPTLTRVNMVSPGSLETSIDLDHITEFPMKRPAHFHECARLVSYLFSDEASYITGQNIEIAGGYGL